MFIINLNWFPLGAFKIIPLSKEPVSAIILPLELMLPEAVISPVILTPPAAVSSFWLPAWYKLTLNASESVFKRRLESLSWILKLILLPPLLIVRGWGVDESLSIVIKGRLPAWSWILLSKNSICVSLSPVCLMYRETNTSPSTVVFPVISNSPISTTSTITATGNITSNNGTGSFAGGIVLTAPNGNQFRFTINNSGHLSLTGSAI